MGSVIADLEINYDKEWMSWQVLTTCIALWSSPSFVTCVLRCRDCQWFDSLWQIGHPGGGGTQKSVCMGRLRPEPFIYILHRKGIPFVFLLTNETPFTHQVKNTESLFTLNTKPGSFPVFFSHKVHLLAIHRQQWEIFLPFIHSVKLVKSLPILYQKPEKSSRRSRGEARGACPRLFID